MERVLRCRGRRYGFNFQSYNIHSFLHSKNDFASVTVPGCGDVKVNNMDALNIGYFIKHVSCVTSGKSLNFSGPWIPYKGH